MSKNSTLIDFVLFSNSSISSLITMNWSLVLCVFSNVNCLLFFISLYCWNLLQIIIQLMRFINAFIIIVFLHRLNECHDQNINDIRFTKYIRKHLIDVYDDLWQKNEFENQIVEWYLERSIFIIMQHRRSSKINVNDDSNLSIEKKSLSDDENDHHFDEQKKQISIKDDDAKNDFDRI